MKDGTLGSLVGPMWLEAHRFAQAAFENQIGFSEFGHGSPQKRVSISRLTISQ
jgi:hypothetical protein